MSEAYQQQVVLFAAGEAHPQSLEPQQGWSVRPSMAPITAAAQPTPVCTEMASDGQFRLQAPHSMHASRSRTSACRVFI
jgi:hypothetical protein